MKLSTKSKNHQKPTRTTTYDIPDTASTTNKWFFQKLISSLINCLNTQRSYFTTFKGKKYADKSKARETAVNALTHLDKAIADSSESIAIAATFKEISTIIEAYIIAVLPLLTKDRSISNTHKLLYGYQPPVATGATFCPPFQQGILDIFNSSLSRAVSSLRESGLEITEATTITPPVAPRRDRSTDSAAPTSIELSRIVRPAAADDRADMADPDDAATCASDIDERAASPALSISRMS